MDSVMFLFDKFRSFLTLLGERHQSGYCEKPHEQKVWKKASRKGAKAQSQ